MAYSAAPDPALDSSSTVPSAAAGSLSHSHSQLQLQLPPASASLQYAATAPLLGTRLFANEGVSSSPATTQLGAQPFAAAPVQLWMGDIEPWMDEECIRQIWARMGELVSVKMIRDRLTGGPANYCFIELPMHTDAERFLALYNGKPMPLALDRPFRLNWASGVPGSSAFTSSLAGAPGYSGQFPVLADGAASAAANGDAEAAEYSLFVGDLAPEVTDVQLVQEFRCRYASVRAAKVVMDSVTMLPRGYGFVRFSDEADRQRALVEMQGHIIGSRAIRVSTATPKRTPTMGSSHSHHHHSHHTSDAAGRESARSPALSESSADSTESYNPATDPFNTTVFVGGLVNPVGEDELHKFFAVYGEVVYCKIPPNRGCGFVTFAKRTNAETAMRALNGHMLGGSRVRLSWGRSQSHARHNYRNHHRHNSSRHHHHQNCHSSNGGASGANSHRNSVSEHHPLYPRRSVSFGKPPASAAPAAVQPSTLGLGLGLSGAPVPGAAPSGSALGMPHQHGLVSLDTANIQPSSTLLGGSSYLGGGMPLGHHPQQQPQPQQQQPLAEHMVPHSAFYTIASGHPGAVPGIEALGSAAVTPLMGQTLGYYYQQPQQQPPQQQQSALSVHNAPGDLLTRRLSALNLNGGSNAVSSVRNSTNDIQPPSLDRRASAGVIGQRRLSTKPSFSQAPAAQPQKAVSQLSLSQLWPQTPTLGDYCGNGPLSQLNDYQGALSTPASSARLSTSSLSLLALPTAGNDSTTADTSARPSMEEQSKRRDQLEFELGGAV
ncbi:hypothetical protein IWW36_000441 [Coemansia brasiliensis]|uniref:RRM domain-containing protein n=1 Tax=Coemansia brasiliensis TaxID=2650707 RepID=A0A9W8M300_9FUNG|nr:hypothetical protein IWW36_000441 [Coemansia brasiliensis]